jgi:hypothetical protein
MATATVLKKRATSYDNILQAIGATPLVRLQRVAAHLSPAIYAKVESLNPGGSAKDRVALRMVEQAESEGLLRPGGAVIEAMAGNTGLGLAMVSAVRGYHCILVLPDKMSQDMVRLLRAYGGEACAAFASGLAACSSILDTLQPGEGVVASHDLYGGTFRLLDKVFRPLGVEVAFAQSGTVEAFAQAIATLRKPRLLWVESPTNPLLDVVDIAALSALARAACW